MDRLLQNKIKTRNDYGGFGCHWMPSAEDDDIYFLKNKNRNCYNVKDKDTLNKYIIFDNNSSKISPKTNRISLKRNKSQTFILNQDMQNNFSEAKFSPNQQPCTGLQQAVQSLQIKAFVTPKQNQNIEQSQLDHLNAFDSRQKNEDKSYNYRSVISPYPNVSFYPQRPFMRHNSSTNDRFNFPAFVPYTPQGNKIMNQQKFRSSKILQDTNYDDDIFGFINEQNGGTSIIKPTDGIFNKNLIVLRQNDQDFDDAAMQKDSCKSCNKSKLSLFTNIYAGSMSSKVSQISEAKPKTMKQLTRMQDVQQIQSVLDDSVDDNNKESIVIDRMTRYSSGGNLLKQLQLPGSQKSPHALQISFMTQVTTNFS